MTLNLGGSFHFDRKRIISSQVSNIPLDKIVNWDYKKRKDLAVSYIQQGVFNRITLNEVLFENAPEHFRTMSKAKVNKLTIIKY